MALKLYWNENGRYSTLKDLFIYYVQLFPVSPLPNDHTIAQITKYRILKDNYFILQSFNPLNLPKRFLPFLLDFLCFEVSAQFSSPVNEFQEEKFNELITAKLQAVTLAPL